LDEKPWKCHVDRLGDVEVGQILDHPAGVARRLVEVDDYRIERAFRIELAAEAADRLLIGPDVAEGRRSSKCCVITKFAVGISWPASHGDTKLSQLPHL
jgi:hypothetical protein